VRKGEEKENSPTPPSKFGNEKKKEEKRKKGEGRAYSLYRKREGKKGGRSPSHHPPFPRSEGEKKGGKKGGEGGLSPTVFLFHLRVGEREQKKRKKKREALRRPRLLVGSATATEKKHGRGGEKRKGKDSSSPPALKEKERGECPGAFLLSDRERRNKKKKNEKEKEGKIHVVLLLAALRGREGGGRKGKRSKVIEGGEEWRKRSSNDTSRSGDCPARQRIREVQKKEKEKRKKERGTPLFLHPNLKVHGKRGKGKSES